MNWLAGKRILVTGGNGFLGRFVVGKLKARGCREVFTPRSRDYNLLEMTEVRTMFADIRPEVVIHLAAKVGGIGVTREKPGESFYENAMMGLLTMEQARLSGVEKFVEISSVCAYPREVSVPTSEDCLWDGYPEETNAPYGVAKRVLQVQALSYRQQYGFNAIYLVPVNLYGPGDDFDPATSHVIPAQIKKCLDAIDNGDEEIVVWGTGTPTREFLYVEDAAEAVVLATEKYDKADPVNLGSGFEISVNELVGIITRITGYQGRIVHDETKPDGQPRRLFDSHRAEVEFGFKARTDFEEGLKNTIEWYSNQRETQG